jgi:hypothetical protein
LAGEMSAPAEQDPKRNPNDDDAGEPLAYEPPGASLSVPPGEGVDDRDDELDGVRIRQLAAVRRGAFRARSYSLIAAVACLVVSIQLVMMTADAVRARGWGLLTVGYVQFAVLALLAAAHFGRRVRALSRELRAPPPLPPIPPGGPDFSTLSDGSQQWKNLDDIR